MFCFVLIGNGQKLVKTLKWVKKKKKGMFIYSLSLNVENTVFYIKWKFSSNPKHVLCYDLWKEYVTGLLKLCSLEQGD